MEVRPRVCVQLSGSGMAEEEGVGALLLEKVTSEWQGKRDLSLIHERAT